MKLSIIIVHFNTSRLTLQCIQSIFQFRPQCDFEILVVDNGSEDGLDQILSERFPEVRFIELGKNIGYGAANNLGILNSKGEFIVLLNSDTKILDFSFDAMLDYFDRHPGVGVLGPRHVDGREKYQLSCGRFPTLFSELLRKLMHYRLSADDHQVREYLDSKFASLTSVDWVSGSCMMIRRSVLRPTGLLDENFFMYFEDIDLCRRVWNQGFAVHYFSDTTILHYGGESARLNLMKVLTEYRRSQIYFTRKYYGPFGELIMRLFLLIKYSLNLLKWGTLYLVLRLFHRDIERAFTLTLLSKKVVLGAFHAISEAALEPRLNRSSIPSEPVREWN